MKRGKIAFFSILGVSLILGLSAYKRLTPRWTVANETDVRTIVRPDLLIEEPEDLVETNRYVRLCQVLNRFRPSSKMTSAGLDPTIEAVKAILDEGPIRSPRRSWMDTRFDSGRLRYLVVKAISDRGSQEVAKGRTDVAADLWALAIRLSACTQGRDTNIGEIASRRTQYRYIFERMQYGLPDLEEAHLASLTRLLPATSADDPDLRRAIRNSFQESFLTPARDPIGWARGIDARYDPTESLNALTHALGEEYDKHEPLIGNYDALDTLRKGNELLVISLENTKRRGPHLDRRAKGLLSAWQRPLPTDLTPGTKEPWKRFRRIQYRVAMADMPNSFGIAWILPFADDSLPITEASLQARTEIESMRTRIALRRYQLRFGKRAPTLEALLKAKLLTSMPEDYLGDGFLQYDPTKGRLWSVGSNGVDDGGKATRLSNTDQPDWVWNVRP